MSSSGLKKLNKRNLYLIKNSLDSFGIVQLPTEFDVLRRLLNVILVERISEKDAYLKVADEIIEVYTGNGIGTIKKVNFGFCYMIIVYILIFLN